MITAKQLDNRSLIKMLTESMQDMLEENWGESGSNAFVTPKAKIQIPICNSWYAIQLIIRDLEYNTNENNKKYTKLCILKVFKEVRGDLR